MPSKLKSETDSEIEFDFVCDGCGAEGTLGILKKDGMAPFGCPEGCGATYVPWKRIALPGHSSVSFSHFLPNANYKKGQRAEARGA